MSPGLEETEEDIAEIEEALEAVGWEGHYSDVPDWLMLLIKKILGKKEGYLE